MKKSRGIAVIILTAIITAFLCYTAAVGLGENHSGAAKNIKKGLDLSGGVSITYQTVESNPSKEDMDDTIYKLQLRVQNFSTEAAVYQEGSDRITVEIPDVTNPDEVLEDIGKPGSLCFVEQTDSEGNSNFSLSGNEYVLSRSLDEIRESGSVVLEGSDVQTAEGLATKDQTTSAAEYVVSLTLTDDGAQKFAEATQKNLQKQIAIVYDNVIKSAPRVQSVISDGKAQITGMESLDEARELASFIRIGSLSLELEEIQSSTVAPQLGVQAIATSLKAAVIGLILVVLIMLFAYRFPGFIAAWALVIYTSLNLILLNAFEVTLTLPGIAGIILGIGMAVDANVIIYARIKEEIGAGQTVKTSIKTGFSKAFSAIFDGNITTLIAALVLMWLGSGPVKGFAYTLTLSIVVSMFTALVVSRLLANAFYAAGVRDEKFYGRTGQRKEFDFVGKRKLFFTISIIAIVCGPLFMAINGGMGKNALNYSLEFSGGTATNVTFNENMSMEELDSQVVPLVEEITGDSNVQITKINDTNQVIIKTRALEQEDRHTLNETMVENFGVDPELIQTDNITGTISKEMRRDAVIAVIVATICMLLYIWLRFRDIRFASSAVIALVHDVLVVLAFYAIARVSVGNTFIACMLTIVGYSINATIVIFDRIREYLHGSSRVDGLKEIVNNSIMDTLTRSIYTSLTTFVMVAVLYIMGVSSIREFALPLMVGIICGGYSSVFITGSLWYVMKTRFKSKAAEAPAAVSKSAPVKAAPKKAENHVPSGNASKEQAPRKKNRKRVAERLAAQQNAAGQDESGEQ